MRAFVQCSLGLVSFAALLSGRVLAQPPQPSKGIEEIIVRGGKTLSQYRLELERAQDDLFELFNEMNEGNDTDIRCRNEAATGSRMRQRVCRSHAEERADAEGARNFLNALFASSGKGSGPGAPQVNATIGMGEALSTAVSAGSSALAQFEAEWARVLGGNRELYETAVEYAELEEEFDRMRGVTRPSTRQPQTVVLGRAGPQCEASTYTEYQQRNNVARISGTVGISACPAGTMGSFTLVAQIRDDAGETRPIEFRETWQRADAQDHVFNSDYPLGENVSLVSVRVRNLTCTCESPPQ
jgi:hypothetical protein